MRDSSVVPGVNTRVIVSDPPRVSRDKTGGQITRMLTAMVPGEALLLSEKYEAHRYKFSQRALNGRIRTIRKHYPERAYTTRVFKAGERIETYLLDTLTIAVYRTE